jgi:4-aminobutyrate aminotransferase-like enzyme/Ser/Thr protein kinase RdoA (MazF antagonist)
MSIVKHAPTLTLTDAGQLAKELYGLDGSVQELPSERDQNFLVCVDDARYVLKIANTTEEPTLLEAQNQVMEHVMGLSLLPRVVDSLQGEKIESASVKDASANGESHFVRLVTYIDGTPMGNVKRHSLEMMFDLGCKLAELDKALLDFDHPALHRDFHWDFANGLDIVRKNTKRVRDRKLRAMVLALMANFEKYTVPLLPSLRTSAIYNDANDYNVLVGGGTDLYSRNQTVTGFIDLGDMVHGYTVSDLAIAIAYAILDKPQPLVVAAEIVKGYHSAFPLTEGEIAAIYGLVTLRLCMSVCIGAEQQQSQPKNEYLGISQGPIRNTLPQLMKIHPRFAEATFREACGLVPFASSSQVVKWLKKNSRSFAQVLPYDLRREALMAFDLGIGSGSLHGDPRENAEPKLTGRLHALMAEAGARVGVGQYDEARYIYTSPVFAVSDGLTDETRTIHLGTDLFADVGTSVHAPLDGKVVACADNAAYQDYGPVIVLEHEFGELTLDRGRRTLRHALPGSQGGAMVNGQRSAVKDVSIKFYTLYGHLTRGSLKKLKVGQKIKKGKKFAEIGSADVNGGWTPHLHFQIMVDLLDLRGTDFPGVALASQRPIWLSLCPDPNLILNIPKKVLPKRSPTKEETLATRREWLGGNLSIAYHSPVKIVRGWMQYLFDENGRRYLDAYNNVAHVGHCHPRVVEAARNQISVLNTNTRYLHDTINRYAERLTSLLPDSLEVCYFVNSASEANELALRLARAYTNQKDMIVLEAAYHGNTTSLIDISPYKHNGPGGTGAPDWVHAVPIPDVFRGEYKADDPQAGAKYAACVKQVMELLRQHGRGMAGFIAESLPSVGGQILFPDGYLTDVYRYVRQAGGVCIADEVQTGFGRVGSHLWGYEMQNIIPDIVVLGKPIGNGHPLAAVVTRREIAEAFNNGMEYFNTFGGNPVSCAVGLAVLDALHEDRLQENSLHVGHQLLAGLKSFVGKYDMVADARGAGLFLGLELVRDPSTLEPAAAEASFIANRMRDHGILLGTDGPYHNVVKIRPPMPFNASDAEFLLERLEMVLREDFGESPA